MKKIALFISSLQKGGSERVMVNLAEFFYRNHYDVLLVTQYKRQDEYEIMPEIKRVYSEPSQDQLRKQTAELHDQISDFTSNLARV